VLVNDRTSEFVALLAAHERGVFKYILRRLADTNAAQEVLQETSVTLWQKFDQFEKGSNFFAWARRVAHFEVMKFRQSRRRDRLRFSEGFLQGLSDEWLTSDRLLRARRTALPDCVVKLPPADRELLEQRYAGNETILEIARRMGLPANTLYKTLERIRRRLKIYIERTVGGDDNEPPLLRSSRSEPQERDAPTAKPDCSRVRTRLRNTSPKRERG
jgi:RNA polymerase sigma-70 factor (ECF subfamily)